MSESTFDYLLDKWNNAIRWQDTQIISDFGRDRIDVIGEPLGVGPSLHIFLKYYLKKYVR